MRFEDLLMAKRKVSLCRTTVCFSFQFQPNQDDAFSERVMENNLKEKIAFLKKS